MKVPVSWLKEYVDFEDSIQGLSDKLTFSGVEVEGIETIGIDDDNIVVAEIREVEKHPDADKLSVCKVFDGKEELQVVCGAPNAEAGRKGAFARIGVTLGEKFKIKKAKIRGVESYGMLCAEDELGLSDDHEGIILFDTDLPAGTPVSEIYGPLETVLELEITPNRPDCLSVIGLARELSALYHSPLRIPRVDLEEDDEDDVKNWASVRVDEPGACPRYTARAIKSITIAPSPAWMQRRLELSGIRPINNVVDITNYVLLEIGQPMHAFDHALLAGQHIGVRKAAAGETMHTLDEQERKLAESMLLITDTEKPVAVAGVMGGAGSEVRDDTEIVLLESAYFEPSGVRATSKALGLSTESSYRFERGVDIEAVDWASRRGAALLTELAGGTLVAGSIDVYPAPPAERTLTCRYRKAADLMGVEVAREEIETLFGALELEVVASGDESCTVKIPTFRSDLTREVDLVEEIARMHGLENIPAPAPNARIIPGADDSRTRGIARVREDLIALGLREIMNYSLVSEGLLDQFDPDDRDRRIVMPNPISQDQSVLRTGLIPQLAESLGRNQSRQIPEATLFEIGRVYWREGGAKREEERVALGLLGPVGQSNFEKRVKTEPGSAFLWIKGILEAFLQSCDLGSPEYKPVERPFFETGRGIELRLGGEVLGVAGLLAKPIREAWRMYAPLPVAELRLDPLLRGGGVKTFSPYAIYPPVNRDMALLVPKALKHGDVLRTIQEVGLKDLEKIDLFDIFEGEGIGDDQKSMAYSLTFRAGDRNLTDEEANALHERVKEAIRRDLKADIR